MVLRIVLRTVLRTLCMGILESFLSHLLAWPWSLTSLLDGALMPAQLCRSHRDDGALLFSLPGPQLVPFVAVHVMSSPIALLALILKYIKEVIFSSSSSPSPPPPHISSHFEELLLINHSPHKSITTVPQHASVHHFFCW